MPPKPGDRFGRYELAELLGKGGMGDVYRAQDTLLHRKVALKVLHPTAADATGSNPSASHGAARILREARAAAGLSHPNAIAIYDVGEVDGVPFLAMELVSGKTLRTFIGDESIPLARRARWMVDVARALGAAHEIGLVHRDIKPENIMVRDDGVVKVLDFGIARHTAASVDPNAATEGVPLGTLTADGVVVGTPFYMAPEQMRGEALDGRSDQFAWGVVAYELMTGALPWDKNATPLQLVAQILSQDAPPPRAKNAELPEAVDAVIARTLAKSRDDRFASMDDVAVELEPHAALGGATSRRSGAGGGSGGRARTLSRDEVFAPTESIASSRGEAMRAPSTRTQLAAPPASDATVGRTWRKVGAVVLAALAVGSVAWMRGAAHRHGTNALPSDASALAEEESQMSANAEATAAYRAGMQAWRDASEDPAKEQFDRAIRLDPLFAAAHLRRALLTTGSITTEVRQDLQSARNSRMSLGERDRVLLDAIEPSTRSPPDREETRHRLELAEKRYSTVCDFPLQLGIRLAGTPEATAAFDRALALDPTLAMAWGLRGAERMLVGDPDGARRSYGECLKLSPDATSCMYDLSVLDGIEGKCEDMASMSRRLIAVAPDVTSSYGRLAQALFSVGEPVDAVRGALQQKWDRLPADARRGAELRDESYLAVLTGHFDEAAHLSRELEQELASAHDDSTHFGPAYDRMLEELEVGHAAGVLSLARDYLRRRAAWQVNELWFELTIYAYAAELSAGGITRAEFDKTRDRWLARQAALREHAKGALEGYAGALWAAAYALPATTREEAVAALASAGDAPSHTALPAPYTDEPIGRTYFLAGRLDEAIPYLTRASQTCGVFASHAPFFSTWASFDLGQALEARGDRAGACASYGRVLARWGLAKPPSRTAASARARARALRCEP